MMDSRKSFLFSIAIILIFGSILSAWQLQITNAQTKPLTYPEISTALNSKLPNSIFKNKTQMLNYMIAQVEKRGVDKALTKDREDDLRQAGATDELINAIRRNSPPLPLQTRIPTPTPVPTPSPTPTISDNSNTTQQSKEIFRPGYVAPFKNSIGMELIQIPRGLFRMGSDAGQLNEKPTHRVMISRSFFMGKTEVTQGQWKAVMGNNPSEFKDCGDNCPVENVSWDDVHNFIKKLNARGEGTYRLPTEAEWEYAARATSNTKYSYGDDESLLGGYAWYDDNAGMRTHPVAAKKPNDWGLYDMHGNVWEWCEDRNGNYSSDSVTDPTGGDSSAYRIVRGGGWTNPALVLRSTIRDGQKPEERSSIIGFRLLRQ